MFIFTNSLKYGKMITARQMRNNLIPGAAEEAGMQVSLQGNLAAIVFPAKDSAAAPDGRDVL